MVSVDRDALLCDFAETYGIYDFRALPVTVLATLAVGLRENSRIKMKLAGTKASRVEVMLAAALDRLSLLWWAQTENGQKNINRPQSILGVIMQDGNENKNNVGFDTAEDFEAAWEKMTGVKHG